MENNNKYKKARINYAGWLIPVKVVEETMHDYALLLDTEQLKSWGGSEASNNAVRNAYLDVCVDIDGHGQTVPHFHADESVLRLSKYKDTYTFRYVDAQEHEPEPEEDLVDSTGIDNVVAFPSLPKLSQLDKQLILMKELGYKVKSWNVSFPEDGEPQLYASFTKEVEK